MKIIDVLKSTLPALIRLGDFIGNEELTPPGGGRGSWWTPYNRCEIISDIRDAIEQLENESVSDTEDGNLMAQDEKERDKEDRYETLYDAAIEAVEYVAQANWHGREEAAKRYLYLVARGNPDNKSLDWIQEEINSA